MSKGLPNQLKWREFVAFLKVLGYELKHNKRGSARTFYNPNGNPHLVTFHEPHRPKCLKKGILSSYLGKLNISTKEFNEIRKGEKEVC